MMVGKAKTPAEAYDLYVAFYKANALIQGNWHGRGDGDGGSEGRDLACGLGMLGPDINAPGDCPAQIMPLWLARMVVFFFDGQTLEDAKDWGLRFYAQIKRLNGQVPFTVVYSWHAEHTAPIAIEAAQKRGRAVEPHEALQALHRRAAAGDRAPRGAAHC